MQLGQGRRAARGCLPFITREAHEDQQPSTAELAAPAAPLTPAAVPVPVANAAATAAAAAAAIVAASAGTAAVAAAGSSRGPLLTI